MSIRDLVQAAVDGISRRDPDPFVAMFAEDGVLEMTLAPPSATTRIKGRAEIARAMASLRDLYDLRVTAPARLYVDETAQVVTIEMAGILRTSEDATPALVVQAVVVEFRNGQAIAWRDYRANGPVGGV